MNRNHLMDMPDNIINDDPYLSISIGAGNIKRIKGAIILQEPVGSFKDYYYRKIRLVAGDRQIEDIFGREQYHRFLKDSRDIRSKRERKRALPILLRVYERFLFPIDVILKIINRIVRRQVNNLKGYIFTDGWETQRSAKLQYILFPYLKSYLQICSDYTGS